ncbi:hypothetical protein O181_109233 [Austropuccinia psidii MF-1]|uniref:Uncharacterized protein n=1 Tax=Austropuccinia psidii MF-1 TaxID=1389203 RepID=A0A9Q3JVP5_9BASI|nr:hypothetical protein [Austropuccinia psidii MF-1]
MAKNHLRNQIGHKSVHVLWQPSEATSAAQKKDFPPAQGETSPSSMHPILKDAGVVHRWYIIPYAEFLLSNPLVTLSEPNYVIQKQVAIPSPISKEEFSAIKSGNSLEATRRPFEDLNHLALQQLGCQFSSGLF